MSLKFASIGQIEHERIPFIDAVTKEDTYNGAFGDVDDQVGQLDQLHQNLGHIIDQGDYLSLCQQPFIYLSAPIPDNRNNPGVDNNICHRIQQR